MDHSAHKYVVSFRLQRITTEQAFVSVPVTADLIVKQPDETGRIDMDLLLQRAIEMGQEGGTRWQAESQQVQPHPAQIPPDDLRDEPANAEGIPLPIFSPEVRSAILLGTSSKWAADLSANDLQVLIWMIGELGRRAPHLLSALDRYWSNQAAEDGVAAARAKLGLEGLFRFVCGERPSLQEFFARWGAISERVWAEAQSRSPDLPAEEMGDLWPVTWDGCVVGWIKDPCHERFGCVGLWIAAASRPADEFATALMRCAESPLLVNVGGVRSLIEQPPTPAGQLSVSWSII